MANPAIENSIFTDERALAAGGRSASGTPAAYGSAPGTPAAYGSAPTTTAPYGQPSPEAGYGYPQPQAGGQPPALGYHPDMVGWKPIADERPMTYDDVIVKTSLVLAVVVGFGLIGATLVTQIPALVYFCAFLGLVLGVVNAVKREPSPAMILVYAAVEGIFLGGISFVIEAQYSGAIMQALLGTLGVFIGGLVAYSRLGVRISSRVMRFTMMVMIGMVLFSLFNLGIMLFGNNDSPWGLRTSVEIMGIPLGVLLGIGAIILGAICLISDFQTIDNGVRAGIPERFAWSAAFGLTVTIVWLYVEFLRLIAILSQD